MICMVDVSKGHYIRMPQRTYFLNIYIFILKSTRRNLIGSAVFGIDDVYSKWKKFVTMRRKGLSSQNQRSVDVWFK